MSTFTRLTNEKPQSPCSMEVNHRTYRTRDGVVEPELLAEVHPDLGRDVGVRGQLAERVAGRQGQDREQDEADAHEHGEQR